MLSSSSSARRSARRTRAAADRVVLVLDAYERLEALDDWLRSWLLPRLPVSALTVVASRNSPGPAWRADPAWHEPLRVVALRNLAPDDSRSYLRACGIDAAVRDRLVRASHGQPLGLSLLAEVVVRVIGPDERARRRARRAPTGPLRRPRPRRRQGAGRARGGGSRMGR